MNDSLVLISWYSYSVCTCKIWHYRYYWKNYPNLQTGSSVPLSHGSVLSLLSVMKRKPAKPCLMSLKQTGISRQPYEVILVDDHSDDGSDIIVKQFCEQTSNFSVYQQFGKDETGKKAALEQGIGHASHEFIVTTDADCTMDEYWLSTIQRFLSSRIRT